MIDLDALRDLRTETEEKNLAVARSCSLAGIPVLPNPHLGQYSMSLLVSNDLYEKLRAESKTENKKGKSV